MNYGWIQKQHHRCNADVNCYKSLSGAGEMVHHPSLFYSALCGNKNTQIWFEREIFVPAGRPDRWRHRENLGAFHWPCTWFVPVSGPGSLQRWWRSLWTPEDGWLQKPVRIVEMSEWISDSQSTVMLIMTHLNASLEWLLNITLCKLG